MNILLSIFNFLLILSITNCTLSPDDVKKNKKKKNDRRVRKICFDFDFFLYLIY